VAPILVAAGYALVLCHAWLLEDKGVFYGASFGVAPALTEDSGVPAPWNEVEVTTEDGVAILLLESWRPDAPDAPWVIYFYGYDGALAKGVNIDRYRMLRDVGLNVLAVEYRGYGESEDVRPTEEGVYADARAAWRYLSERRGVSPSRVILYGFSLGSGVAVQLADEIRPAGLVTENAFTSIPDVLHEWRPWFTTRFLRYRFENLDKAEELATPWLIIHGRRDDMVLFSHAQALAASGGGPRLLVRLDCGHSEVLEREREKVVDALARFAADVIGDSLGTAGT
jgi:dipeptidyl aminopeptidase/acylaminoacyl peptidase